MNDQPSDSRPAEVSLNDFDGTIVERARKCLLFNNESSVFHALYRHLRSALTSNGVADPADLPSDLFSLLTDLVGTYEWATNGEHYRWKTEIAGAWIGMAAKHPSHYDKDAAEMGAISLYKTIRSPQLCEVYMAPWDVASHQLPPVYDTFIHYPKLMREIIDRRDRATGDAELHNKMSELVQLAQLCYRVHELNKRSSNPLPN